MNSQERVQATFQQRKPDKVPIHHIGFSAHIASDLLGREAFVGGGIQQWREAQALFQGPDAHCEFVERSFQDAVDLALFCEHDIVRVRYWRYHRQPTRRLDENTFLYTDGPEENWKILRYTPESEQCHIADYRPRPRPTLDDLAAQVAAEEEAIQAYQPSEADFEPEIRAQRRFAGQRVVRVGAVHLSVPTATTWLEATLLRPDLVARYLDSQVERAARNVSFLAGYGFRYFFGGGDLASDSGPMYSPATFRTLLLPRLKRISDICHQHGGYHLFASDGNLWPVAQDLFGESGVDGYFEIDRRAGMDLRQLRERFPNLTLIGNISSYTAHMGSQAEVIDETLACLEEAASSQGIVVGASNYFVPGTPIENVIAILETIAQHR
jgi:hypothetical protein